VDTTTDEARTATPLIGSDTPRRSLPLPGIDCLAPLDANPFQGFWMGGFEGADHVNADGLALDLVAASGHLNHLEEDHRRAAQAGIRFVRESIGWRISESANGVINLSRALRTQASAHRHGLQVLWTLVHYGIPDGLSLHDDAMLARLARFAAEVARVLGPGERAAGHMPVFTPINEISFLAWAASQPTLFAPPNNLQAGLMRQARDEAGESAPDLGYAAKRRLAAAAIQAMGAIRAEIPEARFMHVEPLIHVVPPQGRDDLAGHAALVRSWQWQAWDILAGTSEPALGGSPAWLDIVGVNYYHNGQWVVDTGERLDWASRDPRRRRFSLLLAEAAERYGRPLVVSETSHVGVGRAAWLHEIAAEVRVARKSGVTILGLCLYPLVDRPDWQHPQQWHRSGLWHVDDQGEDGEDGADGTDGVVRAPALRRFAEPESLDALHQWQHADAQAGSLLQRRPVLLAFSHLRWEFARHRSRHLLQRLAGPNGDWHLVFVEEPLPGAGPPRLDLIPAGPHIHVVVPTTPGAERQPGFCTAQRPVLQKLLLSALSEQGLDVSTVWLSTPMAWPLARMLLEDLPWRPSPRRVFYDCADEFAALHDASPELRWHEEALLCAADGVVCATESLARPRRAVAGTRLLVLGNGVDLAFFSPASAHHQGWDAMEAADLAGHWDGPQLGFAGVIDERVDLALLAALARAQPQWQIVLVGPVQRIDPQTLPHAPNLHWLGEQPYRLLPALMSRWRVALLPFVDSPATRPELPLQVLEALGAGLPVVATPLPELLAWRDAGLDCATGAKAFVAACRNAVAEPPHRTRERQACTRARLSNRTWDQVDLQLAGWLQSRVGDTGPMGPSGQIGIHTTSEIFTDQGAAM